MEKINLYKFFEFFKNFVLFQKTKKMKFFTGLFQVSLILTVTTFSFLYLFQ